MADHSDFLLSIAQFLHARELYIELGVQDGVTYNRLAPLFARAIGVDVLDRAGVCREFFHGKTDDFFTAARLKELRADFIFIDACHEKTQVLKDFNHSLYILKEKTGVIALHDTYPESDYWTDPARCHNAWEISAMLKRYEHIETITLPLNGIHGITLVRKPVDYKPHGLSNESDR